MGRVEIEYRTQERAPGRPWVEEDGAGGCVLTFPLSSAWGVVISMAVAFAVGTFYVIVAVYVYRKLAALGAAPISWGVWAGLAGAVAFWLGCGGWSLWRYRRYGHVPRCVMVDAGAGVIRRRGERSGRWREWRLVDVESVDVRPERGVVLGAGAVVVTARVRGRWVPLAWRFKGADADAAERFVRCLRAVCGERGSARVVANANEPGVG
jgi:hypothetical protein